ncbi:MAG: glucokinase [Methylibium sp. NZG]|nr:MAG: glucokinase [Methylibium sp. NZG]
MCTRGFTVSEPGPAELRPRMLADVGGTNARFAWQDGPDAPIGDVLTLPCAEHERLADAITAYLGRAGRAAPRDCAIAIANPVVGDLVQMTNHHWSFSIAGLKAQFGFERLRVLNDFTALALALPTLKATELRQVGGGAAAPGTAIGLIGPGTGLGVSGLLPDGAGGWAPLQGEGGHVTLAGRTPREHAVLAWIGSLHGHASAERAVSGQGLVDIYRALGALDAANEAPNAGGNNAAEETPRAAADEATRAATAAAPGEIDAASITHAALQRGDARSAEAVNLMCAFLGTAAGNLALTLGARGGVYIGGGIVPRLGDAFARSPFRERFESKGRFSAFLGTIPVFVIHAEQSPALRGAASALNRFA